MFMGIAASSLEAFHCTTRVQSQLHMDQHTRISVRLLQRLVLDDILDWAVDVDHLHPLSSDHDVHGPFWSQPTVGPTGQTELCRSTKLVLGVLEIFEGVLGATSSPALLYAHVFQDEQSVRLVKDKEKNLRRQKERREGGDATGDSHEEVAIMCSYSYLLPGLLASMSPSLSLGRIYLWFS